MCILQTADDVERIYRFVLSMGTAVPALGVLWAVAINVETFAFEELKKRVFTRGFNWQTTTVKGLNEIKPFGVISKRKIRRIAKETINKMLFS